MLLSPEEDYEYNFHHQRWKTSKTARVIDILRRVNKDVVMPEMERAKNLRNRTHEFLKPCRGSLKRAAHIIRAYDFADEETKEDYIDDCNEANALVRVLAEDHVKRSKKECNIAAITNQKWRSLIKMAGSAYHVVATLRKKRRDIRKFNAVAFRTKHLANLRPEVVDCILKYGHLFNIKEINNGK